MAYHFGVPGATGTALVPVPLPLPFFLLGQAKRREAERSEAERSGAQRSGAKWGGPGRATGVAQVAPGWGRVVIITRSFINAYITMAPPVPPWHMASGSKDERQSISRKTEHKSTHRKRKRRRPIKKKAAAHINSNNHQSTPK